MDRKKSLDVLYTSPPMDRQLSIFETMPRPCYLLQLFTIDDINRLNAIAKSKKLSSNPNKKLSMIKQIMEARGFKRLAGGTNRICYKYMEDQRFVVKVAYDHVGLSDNISELYNQEILKPFCCKVFEVSPCGTVGLFERVIPITNREQFEQISDEVFEIIIKKFLGKYILADFGTKFFMNWGFRKGYNPVILDFPYVYELDGHKMYCNRPDPSEPSGFCGGEIDYDDGFNSMKCLKCGKTFLISELRKAIEDNTGEIYIKKEDSNMVIKVTRGDKVISCVDTTKESKIYRKDKFGRRKETPYEYRERKRKEKSRVYVTVTREKVETNEEEVTTKSNYTQYTNPEPKENKAPEYHPSDFNQRVTLNSFPSVNDMYKDLHTTVALPRSGKVYKDGVDMEKDNTPKKSNNKYSDTVRIEETLDIVSRQARELVPDIPPEPKEDEVKEEPVKNDVEHDNNLDIPTYVYNEDEDNKEEESKEDYMLNIIVEPRGSDKKNKFQKQEEEDAIDAYFD